MVEIFIQEKNQSKLLTLKVITSKDKLHPLIEKKEWKSTLISEENNCYLFIDKESNNYNFHSIYEYFVNFSNSSEKSWNIDIKSFVAKDLSEEEAIQAISEGILFGSHQQIIYKQQEKKIARIIT